MSKSDNGIVQKEDVREHYLQHFDPRDYQNTFYRDLDEYDVYFIRWFHDAFNNDVRLTSRSPAQRRVLEVACGPVPFYAACAAFYTSSITMSDFVHQNRLEIKSWMEAKDEALDWSIFFNYLASLDPQRSVGEIKDQLRSSFKAIIPCDLEMDNPLADDAHRSSYDVVMGNQCLECIGSCNTSLLVSRLASLVRPGGILMFAGDLGLSWYQLGDHKCHALPLKEEDLRAALHPYCEATTIQTFYRKDRKDRKNQEELMGYSGEGIYFFVAQIRHEGVKREGESKEDGEKREK